MRVLTIVNSLGMGGIENTLLSCIPYLRKKSVKLTICCFKRGGSLEESFRAEGIEVIYIRKTGIIIFDALQLFIILKSRRFDLVHSRFGYTSGGFTLAAKFLSIPIFISVHSIYPSSLNRFKNPIIRGLLKLQLRIHKMIAMNLSSLIIGHSKANLDMNYKGWEKNSKFKLIYNGINFESLTDNNKMINDEYNTFIKDSNFTFLHIGSFREPKNHSFLIDCFTNLHPEENNLKLVLVGEGNLKSEIVRKVKANNIDKYVYFAGFDNDLYKYFEKANLFLFPSIIEGFGNVLVEAQFMNVPICASDINPHYESVYNKYHEFFFNPKDLSSAIKMINKIVKKIKYCKLESEIIEAKKFAIQNFDIESMSNKLLEVYEEKITRNI